MEGYYYLHTNGSLIYKNAVVVESDPEYFNSPFVKKFWPVVSLDRFSLLKLLTEAKELGALPSEIERLEKKNNVIDKDYEIYKRVCAGEDMNKVVAELIGDELEKQNKL